MAGIYLISYSVSGIKNIDKMIDLSFYKKSIDRKFDIKGYNLKGIYGANGAGKTAVIASVRILKRLLTENNYLSSTAVQNELQELINRKTRELEMKAEYLVSYKNLMFLYHYEVKLGKNAFDNYEIVRECLTRRSALAHSTQPEVCFETDCGRLITNNDDAYSAILTDLTKNLLSNATVTSVIFNKEELRNPASVKHSELWVNTVSLLLFGSRLFVCTDQGDDHRSYHMNRYLDSGEEINENDFEIFFEQIKDLNSRNAEVLSAEPMAVPKDAYALFEERVNKLYEFLHIFKEDLKKIDIDRKEDERNYICSLVMNYGDYAVNAEFESTGIKKLIRLFDYFDKMVHGNIVFIDELDSNLHDVYLCALLEYLQENGKGQLCFTTHNVGPMDILKQNKKSIDFLSADHTVYQWVINGNYSPAKLYKKGMIEGSPFNVFPFEFIKAFYTEEDDA